MSQFLDDRSSRHVESLLLTAYWLELEVKGCCSKPRAFSRWNRYVPILMLKQLPKCEEGQYLCCRKNQHNSKNAAEGLQCMASFQTAI